MAAARVSARPQVRIGDYVVDFLADNGVVVECDGARYHDEEADARRDATLEATGHRVVRFTGSRIAREADACAREVADAVARRVPPNRPIGHDGLRERQIDAILHGSGPAVVLAPAGSGKTRVVEERIRALIRQGVAPERICALSFTNAAVDEMEARLGADGTGVRFTTLHALASDICRERYGPRSICQGSSPGGLTRAALVRTLLRPSEFRARSAVRLWVNALSEYRQSLRLPDLGELPIEDDDKAGRFLEVHAGYETALARRNATDFEGLVLDAIRLLTSEPVRRLDWAGRYDHWIVDEFQDLPAGKLKLVRLLAAPHRNLFLVGDDDQVIYGFAGATPRGLLDLNQSLPDIREYVLDTNFRCPHELVVRSQWLIRRNLHRKDKGTVGHRPLERDERVVVRADAAYDQVAVDWVTAQISRGAKPEDIALLFRIKDMAAPVEHALRAAGLRFTPCARPDFYELPVVLHTRSWLRVVSGSATAQDFERSLKWPTLYLTSDATSWLIDAANPEERIAAAAAQPQIVPRSEKQTAEELGNRLKRYSATVLAARRHSAPLGILRQLSLDAAADAFPAPAGAAPARVTLAILARVASYFQTVADMERWIANEADDPDYAPPETLADDELKSTPPTGSILLASVHAAKGRQFPAVAVLGPLDGMPDKRAETDEQLEEERRVAYVAVTRAQEQLLFCASKLYASELNRSPDGITWLMYRDGGSRKSSRNSTTDRPSRRDRPPIAERTIARPPAHRSDVFCTTCRRRYTGPAVGAPCPTPRCPGTTVVFRRGLL